MAECAYFRSFLRKDRHSDKKFFDEPYFDFDYDTLLSPTLVTFRGAGHDYGGIPECLRFPWTAKRQLDSSIQCLKLTIPKFHCTTVLFDVGTSSKRGNFTAYVKARRSPPANVEMVNK